MKPTKIIATLTFAALLAGCQVQPQQTLSQKLQGKSPAESKEVLRLACLNEAEAINPKKRIRRPHSYITKESAELKEMKNICRDMNDNYNVSNENSISLAKQCEDKIKSDTHNKKARTGHFEHMKEICEKMTGQTVNINN